MNGLSAVFVDTSGWIALLNRDDRHHLIATQVMETFANEKRRLITTDWVFAEAGNSLARTSSRLAIVAAVTTFARDAQSKLVRVDAPFWDQALALYAQAKDKTWGLVDCASFVVMRAEGMSDALTSDRHFQQAGFRCLLPITS